MDIPFKAYTNILESIITIQESHTDPEWEKTCLHLMQLLIHMLFINIQRVSLRTLQRVAVTAFSAPVL